MPRNIDIKGSENYFLTLDAVHSIHDLHIWSLTTTETALAVRLVATNDSVDNAFPAGIASQLHDLFYVGHITVQVEPLTTDDQCQLMKNG